jgi:CheY-like chemotaxis protein
VLTASATSGADIVAKGIDGSTTTRWSTGIAQSAATTQTLTIDMLSAQAFDKITLDSAADYARSYQVFVSNTPGTWGTAVASDAGDGKLIMLVIDDMENVHKKLRSMIPEAVELVTAMSVADGLNAVRGKKFKAILVDAEIQPGGPAPLVKQLRLLAPAAGIWGMALRSANNVSKEMRDLGFDDALLKPFTQESIDTLIEQYAAKNETLFVAKEELIELTPFLGKEDKLERYFAKLSTDVRSVVQKLGEACFEKALIDATHIPLQQPARVAQFLVDTFKTATDLGIAVQVVGSPDLPKAMRGFQETKDLHCFASVEEARSQAA